MQMSLFKTEQKIHGYTAYSALWSRIHNSVYILHGLQQQKEISVVWHCQHTATFLSEVCWHIYKQQQKQKHSILTVSFQDKLVSQYQLSNHSVFCCSNMMEVAMTRTHDFPRQKNELFRGKVSNFPRRSAVRSIFSWDCFIATAFY